MDTRCHALCLRFVTLSGLSTSLDRGNSCCSAGQASRHPGLSPICAHMCKGVRVSVCEYVFVRACVLCECLCVCVPVYGIWPDGPRLVTVAIAGLSSAFKLVPSFQIQSFKTSTMGLSWGPVRALFSKLPFQIWVGSCLTLRFQVAVRGLVLRPRLKLETDSDTESLS